MKNIIYFSLTVVTLISFAGSAVADDVAALSLESEEMYLEKDPRDEPVVYAKKIQIYCGKELIGTVNADFGLTGVSGQVPRDLVRKINNCDEKLSFQSAE